MESYERELLVYRISKGFLKMDDLEIHSPNLDILYEAQRIYADVFKESSDAMGEDDMLLELLNRDLMTQYENTQLEEVLPKHLEEWKINLFTNFNDDNERLRIEKYIKVVKNELNSLHKKRHAYDHLTAGGVAMFSKWYYIIENSTYKFKSLYDFSDKRISQVLEFYNRNIITEEQIREVARTEPWRSIWSAGKKNGSIFPKSGCELFEEQRRLINWSNLYDNIQDYEDCPSEEIINYDDALDGWLLVKRKERESKRNESAYKNKIEKFHPNAEVFIPVANQKEASKVYSLNNTSNRQIISNRINLIQNKGEVKDLEFTDVKLQAKLAQNQAYIQSRKER